MKGGQKYTGHWELKHYTKKKGGVPIEDFKS